jgi:hypothetical protein
LPIKSNKFLSLIICYHYCEEIHGRQVCIPVRTVSAGRALWLKRTFSTAPCIFTSIVTLKKKSIPSFIIFVNVLLRNVKFQLTNKIKVFILKYYPL